MDKTEAEILKAIKKKLAVRQENNMVARVKLHNMRQDRDVPIHAFGARLAYGHRCQLCHRDHHYESVCHSTE